MPAPNDIILPVHSPVVELFELSEYNSSAANNIFRFANVGDVIWQGQFYQGVPCGASGFEFKAGGSLPRPKIRVSNINGLVSSLVAQYSDLIGAKLVRRRTLEKYLDRGETPDPTMEFLDPPWYVDRKTGEETSGEAPFIEWELVSSLDLEGIGLPKRSFIANTCTWTYRGAGCGYTGGAIAERDDTPTNDPNLDDCGKRLASCRLRFGQYSVLPFGGFPGCTRA